MIFVNTKDTSEWIAGYIKQSRQGFTSSAEMVVTSLGFTMLLILFSVNTSPISLAECSSFHMLNSQVLLVMPSLREIIKNMTEICKICDGHTRDP